jgi:hypothetical protein
MSEPIDEELARLRARAYGPGADIDDDPRALARLRELEERPRGHDRGLSAVDAPPDHDLSGVVLPPPPPVPPRPPLPSRAVVGEVTALAEVGGATASTVSSTARRTRLAQMVGVAATAAVIATALSVPVTLWAASGGHSPRAVLAATDAPVADDYFGPGSDAVRYEDFIGTRVTIGTIPGQPGRCILIEIDPQGTGTDWVSGTTQGTCSAPGFDPVLDVSVDQMAFTDEQLAALDGATGVRFEASGDQVRVYLATAPEQTADS